MYVPAANGLVVLATIRTAPSSFAFVIDLLIVSWFTLFITILRLGVAAKVHSISTDTIENMCVSSVSVIVWLVPEISDSVPEVVVGPGSTLTLVDGISYSSELPSCIPNSTAGAVVPISDATSC